MRAPLSFNGRNEGDAMASLIMSHGQSLDTKSSIINTCPAATVLPGCVGLCVVCLFLSGRFNMTMLLLLALSPRSACDLQRLMPICAWLFHLWCFCLYIYL